MTLEVLITNLWYKYYIFSLNILNLLFIIFLTFHNLTIYSASSCQDYLLNLTHQLYYNKVAFYYSIQCHFNDFIGFISTLLARLLVLLPSSYGPPNGQVQSKIVFQPFSTLTTYFLTNLKFTNPSNTHYTNRLS